MSSLQWTTYGPTELLSKTIAALNLKDEIHFDVRREFTPYVKNFEEQLENKVNASAKTLTKAKSITSRCSLKILFEPGAQMLQNPK